MDPTMVMRINAAVVAAYLVGMIALGAYLSRYVRDAEDFFLAGRSLNKWVLAGTIMATNVAAIYLVGPAGASYAGGGVAVLLIAWTGNMLAALSALWFVPRFRRMGISTVSEFLEERYGLWLRLLPAALWIIYYALFSGNAMYTLSVALSPVLPWDLPYVVTGVGVAVILYCTFSGLVAVAYTSVLQAFLMIIGGLILLPLALKEVGGLGAFAENTPEELFTFWKGGPDAPWPNSLQVVMFILLGLPFRFSSQYLLQRSFAGRTVRSAARGMALAALFTGPLTLSYILPGICATQIFEEGTLEAADSVLPQLLAVLLPAGLGGLFIAALVAASNSTASALLNSLATLAEHDFYRRFLPDKSTKQYVWFGRFATIAGGAVGLLFAFSVEQLGGIIQANFKIMSLFEPPLFVVVAAALFWPRANAWGALITVIIGVGYSAIGWIAADVQGAAAFFENIGLSAVFVQPEEVRTIVAFIICPIALVAGSLIGERLKPLSAEARQRAAELHERAKTPPITNVPAYANWGIALAIVSLMGFIACAVFEGSLPKPENILLVMGTMMLFVLGCYMAIPRFVEPEEPAEEAAAGSIEASLFQKLFGTGWSWLVIYAVAIALVVILYFI